MDERLIRLFDDELRHLRETAGEFARAFPAQAGALALGESPPDPYVERLLEGVAFMAARVRLKLDAQFPQFTQSIFETLSPDLLAPVPSMLIVRFASPANSKPPPEGTLIKRRSRIIGVPRQTSERTSTVDTAPCTFELGHEVRLLPVELAATQWLVGHTIGADVYREFGARAALKLRLRRADGVGWPAIALDPLVVFISPKDGLGFEIVEQLCGQQSGLVVRDVGANGTRTVWMRHGTFTRLRGFAPDDALLPHSSRTFEGIRLLREYFALPERFLFLEFHGFREALGTCEGVEIEIMVPLREAQQRLEQSVNRTCFELYCAPAVNLFTKSFSQVVDPSRFAEFHVVPDANRPLDFEIHTIETMEGFGDSSARGRRFVPFFEARHGRSEEGAFFVVNRQPRLLTAEQRSRYGELPYSGSEVYVALVDSLQRPFSGDLQQLVLEVRCTNRHLPFLLREGYGDWKLEGGIKAEVEVRVGPTLPAFEPIEGEYAWQLVSALSANYLSLVDDPEDGPSALRELLLLYAGPRARRETRQIEALRRTSAMPIQRAVVRETPGKTHAGAVFIGRGLEVTVEFDQAVYESDRRLFILGAILEQYFARYVSLQSFTETVLRTWPDGKERMRWPHRAGVQPWF